MRKFFEKILYASLFAIAIAGAAQAETMRVIVYGDGLIAGDQLHAEEAYAAKLGRKIRDIGYTNVELVNMSSGDLTTTSAAEQINAVLSQHPDVVVVALGSNDALRGTSTDVIYNNLMDIIGKLQQEKIYVVVLGVKATPGLGPDYGKRLDEVYSRLSAFYRMAFYPNLQEGITGNAELSMADGYYPNGKGIDLLVENTFRMVDAGLRWRYEVLEQERQYEQSVTPPSQVMPNPTMGTPPTATK
jgi:acyl-CoA thioesterase-1